MADNTGQSCSDLEPWDHINETLTALCASLPLKRVIPAYGLAPPPQDATISASPRIVICLAGENLMQIPEGPEIRTLRLRPAEAIFVAKNAWNHPLHTYKHTFLTLDFKANCVRHFWMAVLPDKLNISRRVSFIRPGATGAAGGHIIRALEAMLARDRVVLPSVQALTEALIRETATECTSDKAEALTKGFATWQLLCQYIEDHLHDPIKRDDLAAVAGLHPNHVSRLFRQHGQESFGDYLTRMRMERAARLLARYALPLKEIAARCGYAEPAYFSNVFRARYGMSPGRYRSEQIVDTEPF